MILGIPWTRASGPSSRRTMLVTKLQATKRRAGLSESVDLVLMALK